MGLETISKTCAGYGEESGPDSSGERGLGGGLFSGKGLLGKAMKQGQFVIFFGSHPVTIEYMM